MIKETKGESDSLLAAIRRSFDFQGVDLINQARLNVNSVSVGQLAQQYFNHLNSAYAARGRMCPLTVNDITRLAQGVVFGFIAHNSITNPDRLTIGLEYTFWFPVAFSYLGGMFDVEFERVPELGITVADDAFPEIEEGPVANIPEELAGFARMLRGDDNRLIPSPITQAERVHLASICNRISFPVERAVNIIEAARAVSNALVSAVGPLKLNVVKGVPDLTGNFKSEVWRIGRRTLNGVETLVSEGGHYIPPEIWISAAFICVEGEYRTNFDTYGCRALERYLSVEEAQRSLFRAVAMTVTRE